jgi:hypothetical protein
MELGFHYIRDVWRSMPADNPRFVGTTLAVVR